jgi:hypothetical protein
MVTASSVCPKCQHPAHGDRCEIFLVKDDPRGGLESGVSFGEQCPCVMSMDEKRAREILGDAIRPDGSLDNVKQLVDLQGNYDADQLEALAWWIRNTKVQK